MTSSGHCFSAGIQEAARAARGRVSPLNSAVAGGISGYVLSAIHCEAHKL